MGVKNAFLGRLLASSDKFSDEQVAQTINLLIEHAVTRQASDIHIEPHDRFAQVRYRIDNVLRSIHKLPLPALPAVITQLKEQAGMKTALDHLPQEGQYATLVGEDQFEIQVYTMPVIGGEKVVLHLTRRLNEPPSLEQLGFWGQALNDLRQAMTASHGLIVVATPRRHGKTTTLHSILQTINSPAISIATIEDSIEFRLRGASQTLANTKHGVKTIDALQAALNQDPNVLMLGNLPDRPSANAAVQAAVGGHLVIVGMHADNTAKAVAQLQTMCDEKFLFSSAVKAAISQRLVRRLCTHCAIHYTPDLEEIRSLEKAFGIRSLSARQKIHLLEQQAIQAGFGGRQAATTPNGIVRLWRASEEGCEICHHTGYQGILGITEVLPTQDNDLETSLLSATSADKIRRIALKNNFIPMELDGLIKALRGQTTLAELLRVLSA